MIDVINKQAGEQRGKIKVVIKTNALKKTALIIISPSRIYSTWTLSAVIRTVDRTTHMRSTESVLPHIVIML